MLFDLQGRRKTFIKWIYLALALLMGGGLVLFGVGSNVSGGLADYFTSGDSAADTGEYQKKVAAAEAAVEKAPKDAAAYEELIKARLLLAGAGDNYNRETFTFSESGQTILVDVGTDWKAYLKIVDDPDPRTARFAVQAFVNTQDAAGATSAQRIVADDTESASDYLALFQYALASGDERVANLSAKRAVKLTPSEDRRQVKNEIRDLRKRYEKAQQEGLSEQVQEQVNQQLNPDGGGGGLGGLGVPAPAPEGGQ
jgi:hypothetical protein